MEILANLSNEKRLGAIAGGGGGARRDENNKKGCECVRVSEG